MTTKVLPQNTAQIKYCAHCHDRRTVAINIDGDAWCWPCLKDCYPALAKRMRKVFPRGGSIKGLRI